MNKRYSLLVLFCILIQFSKGQNNNPYAVPDVLPPSPNAAALGKYGGLQPGLASGAVNVNIPIYEYSSRNIKLPISIDYSSSGLKVDEIASRSGQGWVLNAGGVITRTVRGTVDDDYVIRMVPPDNYRTSTWPDVQKLNFMEQIVGGDEILQGGVGPYGTVDGQPDMFNFNFNGYTGQFILDTIRNQGGISGLHYGQPLLLSHSGLKIVKDSPGFDFRAITTEGVQYLFNTLEFTSSSSSGTVNCNNYYGRDVRTGWYLSKIIHPNKDTVNFTYRNITTNYTTGISETIYAIGQRRTKSTDCSSAIDILPNSTCENILTTNGVYLDEINSTTGGKVKFNYMARTDYNDQLVSSIAVYAPGQTSPLKTFSFTYRYAGGRPFLMSLSEKDAMLATAKTHKFGYKDLSEVPARLSRAQDHWGYYNGRNENSTMIPVPIWPSFQQKLPNANADRNPNPVYAMKGILSSVTYPTGGKDSIQYEGNQAYQMTTVGPTPNSISANTNGSTWPAYTYSSTADLYFEQLVNLYVYCNSDRTEDDDLKQTQFTIRNASNAIVYSKTLGYNQAINENIVLSTGSYTIEVSVYGSNITGGGSMSYLSGSQQTPSQNINAPGLRVAKVLTYENATGTPQVKKYRYHILGDPSISSGAAIDRPFYERLLTTYSICPIDCRLTETDYYNMYSSSINNVYCYASSPTTYANVIESFGDNDENGRIEHTFTVVSDVTAFSYLGETFWVGVPTAINSVENGKEIYQGIYKKEGSNLIPIKKVYTHYNMNPTVNGVPFFKNTWGGVANRRFSFPANCPVDSYPLTIEEFKLSTYDLMVYDIPHKWFYVDSVLTRTYDAGGQDYVDQVTLTKYADPSHALPTSVVNYKSSKEVLNTFYTYPSNYPSTAPYPDMVAKHILSPVIEQTEYKGTVFLNAIRTNYYNPFVGVYVPETVQSKSGLISNPYDTRLRFQAYNDFGSILGVSKENGSKICYVWSYNGKYPIAKIENVDYSVVQAALGGQSPVLSFRSNMNPTDAMVNSFLAPLQAIPNAMVTRYTYQPLIGVTTMTDPKGQITYYTYDNLQRLKSIKDQNGNIIKNTIYFYKP